MYTAMGLALSTVNKQIRPHADDGNVAFQVRMPKSMLLEIKAVAEARGAGINETLQQLVSFGLVREWDRQENNDNRGQLAQMLRSQIGSLDSSQLRLLVDVALNLER